MDRVCSSLELQRGSIDISNLQVDIDPKVEARLTDENGNITREDFIKFAQVKNHFFKSKQKLDNLF